MQDRCFRGPAARPVAKWEALKYPRQSSPLSCANCFLAALTTPPQASTPRCVPALCDETLPTSPQHGVGGRGFCRSRCLSCFQPMRGGDGMRNPPTAWLRSHPPCQKTKTYIKTKWARASSSLGGPYHYPKAACVPPREWIPLMQLFHICDFSLPTRLFFSSNVRTVASVQKERQNLFQICEMPRGPDSITPSNIVSFLGLVLDGPIGINYSK